MLLYHVAMCQINGLFKMQMDKYKIKILFFPPFLNFRSDSGNTSTNGNNYLSVDYPGSYSNSSTLERSSYKPASRSNSTNLFANNNDKDADNTSSSTNNTTVIDNAVTNSSNGNSGSRKQSMDLSNGALDLTRRINETLARHGKFS